MARHSICFENCSMSLEETATTLGFPVVAVPPLSSRSKDLTIAFLVGHLVERCFLDPKAAHEIVERIVQREALGSTGFGSAVAVPHVLVPSVSKVVGILGRCAIPVPWEAVDGEPVETICLILGPSDHGIGDYLRALEKVARAINRYSKD
jgi:mannitol/fructose-specific phosphotransferase system IIA component (Ntr-type)